MMTLVTITVPGWVIGVIFMPLVAVQVLWAVDLLAAEIAHTWRKRRTTGWRASLAGLWHNGSWWLGHYNLWTGVLHAYFVYIAIEDYGDPVPLVLVVLVGIGMALPAAMAWYWLPRRRREV